MARNGSGIYSKPSGTTAVSGTTIESSKYNELMDDYVADMNAPRPVVVGGTGASNAADARINLGVVIGTQVQGYDAGLASLAGLTTAANKGIYTTGADTYATYDLTALSRTFLANTTEAGMRSTLALSDGATAAKASTVEAEAGANDDKFMTPLKTKQAIDSQVGTLTTSAALTFPANSSVTFSHGLGVVPDPDKCGFYLVWKGGNVSGFQNGARVFLAGTGDDDASGFCFTANDATLRFGSSDSPTIRAANGASSLTVSAANVDVYLWARG